MARQQLQWGRRYLMCPPQDFRVTYSINPWMDLEARVDADLALAQWHELVRVLRAAGAVIETIEPLPDAPDMVYAMNYGLVDRSRVVMTNFRHAERASEVAAAARWFTEAGYEVLRLPEGVCFEAGDAFLLGDRLAVAAGPRTDRAAHVLLEDLLGVRVLPVTVTSPALYHLDLSLCPLDDERALVVPGAWDEPSWTDLRALVPDPLVVDTEDAYTFCANSVVVGRTVVMPRGVPRRVAHRLGGWGFEVVEVDVSELHKGGGSVRCMTLPLDTVLDPARQASAAAPV